MSARRRALLPLLLAAVQAACIGIDSVPCGDGYCRATEVCVSEGVAAPLCLARADSCAAYPEGTPCVGGVCQGDTCTATAPGCGDAVVTPPEQCDEGAANSDLPNAACRTNCLLAHCGDGARDDGEACDNGPANSDHAPNACRSTCSAAHCGDGIIDFGEERGCLRAPAQLLDLTFVSQVTPADVDLDGRLDVITVQSQTGLASVHFAQPGGGFEVVDVPTTFPIESLAVGDVDGDGDPDLVTLSGFGANHQLKVVQVAGRTMTIGLSLSLPSPASGPLVARLNQDQLADIVIGFDDGTVRVLLASGGGGFAPAVDYPIITQGSLASLHAADVTGDGITDLVLQGMNGVSVLDGAPFGTFTLPDYIGPMNLDLAAAVLVEDLDGDEFAEVVIATVTGELRVYSGDLGGIDWGSSHEVMLAGSSPIALASGDVDGDRLEDVFTLGADGQVRTLWSAAGGALAIGPAVATVADGYRFAVDDLDGDGFIDVLVAPSGGGVTWLRGGDGPVGRPRELLSGNTNALTLGRFDADGELDLVLAIDNAALVLVRGASGARFGAAEPIEANLDATEVVSGDFDGDGDRDVIALESGTSAFHLHRGDGQGGFGAVVVIDTTGAYQLRVMDTDGDGKDDVVGANGQTLAIWYGTASGVSAVPSVVADLPDKPHQLELADLDGDGRTDVVMFDNTTVSYYAGIPGGFAAEGAVVLTHVYSGMAVGDADGDGAIDLVLSDDITERIELYYGAPGAALISGPVLASVPGARTPVCGQLDPDSRCDVLFVRNEVELDLTMAEPGRQLAGLQAFASRGRVNQVVVVDIDGDGRGELLLREKKLSLGIGFRP